ncbi:MAG: hypothetical protein H0V89_08955, partial [Deltaproteobacteria bacterium]|nr:hypothetical protein [Deltaproteobacteria bacterium]
PPPGASARPAAPAWSNGHLTRLARWSSADGETTAGVDGTVTLGLDPQSNLRIQGGPVVPAAHAPLDLQQAIPLPRAQREKVGVTTFVTPTGRWFTVAD